MLCQRPIRPGAFLANHWSRHRSLWFCLPRGQPVLFQLDLAHDQRGFLETLVDTGRLGRGVLENLTLWVRPWFALPRSVLFFPSFPLAGGAGSSVLPLLLPFFLERGLEAAGQAEARNTKGFEPGSCDLASR